MPDLSELTFVRVLAHDTMRVALEKLLRLSAAAALTHDELCEVSALQIQIAMAQRHAERSQRARSP